VKNIKKLSILIFLRANNNNVIIDMNNTKIVEVEIDEELALIKSIDKTKKKLIL
tara:strand:- start:2088 stop:2249 length:162 start_codon:yes stop_codon:yes gene_type:complete